MTIMQMYFNNVKISCSTESEVSLKVNKGFMQNV